MCGKGPTPTRNGTTGLTTFRKSSAHTGIEHYCTVVHLWMKQCSVTMLSKATEQYGTVVLFVLLYSVVLTFSSVDQTMQ